MEICLFEFVRCKRTSGGSAILIRSEGLRCDRKIVDKGCGDRRVLTAADRRGPYDSVESKSSWFEGTKRWAVPMSACVCPKRGVTRSVQAPSFSLFRRPHGIELSFHLTNFLVNPWEYVFHVLVLVDVDRFPHGNEFSSEWNILRKILVGASWSWPRRLPCVVAIHGDTAKRLHKRSEGTFGYGPADCIFGARGASRFGSRREQTSTFTDAAPLASSVPRANPGPIRKTLGSDIERLDSNGLSPMLRSRIRFEQVRFLELFFLSRSIPGCVLA